MELLCIVWSFCFRNIEWLEDKLKSYVDNVYLVLELPTQIELYTYFAFKRDLVGKLESWGLRL
jgi:hypothetical protein